MPKSFALIIDSHFPNVDFFVEFERFDRHIEKLRRAGKKVDYVSTCSPNYLHDAHIRFAMRSNAHAICEKPLVLNPWNLDALLDIEKESEKKVYTILQLRLHPSIIALKEKVTKELAANPNKVYNIELAYLTSRGHWYFVSWKGDESKSDGIASNMGVHFFDMLSWIFGDLVENTVHIKTKDTNAGILRLKNATVKWFLSVSYDYVLDEVKTKGQRTYRSVKVGDEEIEFSEGFTDLHTRSYEDILSGGGFGLSDVRGSIEIVSDIRKTAPAGIDKESHRFCIQLG